MSVGSMWTLTLASSRTNNSIGITLLYWDICRTFVSYNPVIISDIVWEAVKRAQYGLWQLPLTGLL